MANCRGNWRDLVQLAYLTYCFLKTVRHWTLSLL